MMQTKITKKSWFKPLVLVVIFIGLIILIGRIVIFSHPRPMQFYLEFLDKRSERNLKITTYSKEEFFQKYLNTNNDESYQVNNFLNLFNEKFNHPVAKENNFFIVYRVPDEKDACLINIYGINKKRDLVYVSSQNICLKYEQK